MSKKLRILAVIVGSALMITGCENNENVEGNNNNTNVTDNTNQNNNESNNNNNNDANNNNGKKEYNIEDYKPEDDVISFDNIEVTPPDDIPPVPPIRTVTCEQFSRGTAGGSLTDFMVGSWIEPNYTYTCSFKHDKTFSGEYTVRSDDRTIAQVSHAAGTGSFTVKGITPGDAIITAVTDEGETVLQFVAHVRERLPIEKIPEHLYSTDVFYGLYYGCRLSFLEKDPLKGVLTGSDDFETSMVNFKLIDGIEEKIFDGTDFNTYKYRISVDTETSITNRTYTFLYVSTTGDKIFMYYSNGLIDMFSAENVKIR